MTSKEALNWLKQYNANDIKYCNNQGYGTEKQQRYEMYLNIEKECLKIIKKDLDVLEQYKAIKDELGIDLITLCKTFEEDIYIKPDNKIIFVKYDKKEFRFYEGNINCNTDDGNFTVSIDNYGKTWALTREELENEETN